MADYKTIRTAQAGARTLQIDEGLRAHMTRVYGLMSVAMLITAVAAWFMATLALSAEPTPYQTLYLSPLKWVVMFAPLAVVFAFGSMLGRMSLATAQMVFWAFAALMGVSISWIFAVYTSLSVVQTFLITSISFAGLSLYGYTTKRDLSGMGTFLMMGLIGLIVAMVVNLFLHSAAMQFAISVIGVLIFAGLTAFDTQNIKNTYLQLAQSDAEFLGKTAIMGALQLYLDFLNMFMFLLQFLGNRN